MPALGKEISKLYLTENSRKKKAGKKATQLISTLQWNLGTQKQLRVGYLVYLSTRDVPFFRASFSPIFPGTGCQNKAIFLEPIVKTCEKGKFC